MDTESNFSGLSEGDWECIRECCFPSQPSISKRGRRPAESKKVLNSILWYLTNKNARWADLPEGDQWGSRSTSHRRLINWRSNGILRRISECLDCNGILQGQIEWSSFFYDEEPSNCEREEVLSCTN